MSSTARGRGSSLNWPAEWLTPGGTIVYSVCSLEPEEGELVAQAFLAAHPDFAIEPIRQEEIAQGMAPSKEGWLRVLPGVLAEHGGADSFFIVRLRRR